jgi:hypothetical protein
MKWIEVRVATRLRRWLTGKCATCGRVLLPIELGKHVNDPWLTFYCPTCQPTPGEIMGLLL